MGCPFMWPNIMDEFTIDSVKDWKTVPFLFTDPMCEVSHISGFSSLITPYWVFRNASNVE